MLVAVQGHWWPLLAALVVGALVALAKQGWLSAWLALRLTPTERIWFALLVSALTTGSGDLSAGKSATTALGDVLLTFAVSVLGHQTVIESLRGGREIVPPRSGSDEDG